MGLRGLTAISILTGLFLLASCSEDPEQNSHEQPVVTIPEKPVKKGPEVNADTIYRFIEQQVAFGPRVPNTDAHKKCAQFIQDKLKQYGMEVTVQRADATAFDGKVLHMMNIMGKYKPEAKERVALFAHWDTRPFADRDQTNKDQPIDGANDGASGVAVLLEVARTLQNNPMDLGVDLVFFDAEDYGQPADSGFPEQRDTYCLGSQYWSKNLPPGYKPKFGILLDMVGGKNAVFPKEGTSMAYAPHIVEKVWSIAGKTGYGHLFINQVTGETIDDHLYVNYFAKIPSVDIVHYDPNTMDYGPFHHRHTDNLSVIEKSTLKAVGNVVMTVLANE